MSFVASLSVLQEPNSFAEAVTYPEWRDAMERFKLWRKTDTTRSKGSIIRRDFSPAAKAVTVQLFLALAISYAWPIQQLDINNAFLHGYLDEDLCMRPTEGYDVELGMVWTYFAQTKYILDTVKDAGLLHCKAATTPLPQACAAARVDASRIKANKASCISCIIVSWGETPRGGGSTWGGVGACSWGDRSCPLSGACSWGGRTCPLSGVCSLGGMACPLRGGCLRGRGLSAWGGVVHRVALDLPYSLVPLRCHPPHKLRGLVTWFAFSISG
ncbi:UNVERIFIED_CONTAM: hypothetical protein Scaly_2523100 [Sesamum calycinum]|uniref:Reverse transcriptase Ty1/copia-type domain-containing protein n=1 Tax=Sesamum calycinum TaxID=2727403 RepID=A0AAW2LTV5_9LAMI